MIWAQTLKPTLTHSAFQPDDVAVEVHGGKVCMVRSGGLIALTFSRPL